jgi:dihydrofolate reductase
MDYQVIWDDEALAEVAEAVRFISAENPAAARKTGEAILQKVQLLRSFPRLGRVYSKLNREDVRETPVPPYRVFYQIKDAERIVRILKVQHGARSEPELESLSLNETGTIYRTGRPYTAIAAMSLNRVIGNGSKIPWHLPEDFKWFKQVTMGQVLVMGRKTFESIGKPLPGRETIVLTRGAWSHPGVTVVHSLNELVEWSTKPLTRPPATLSPSDGERDGVRGALGDRTVFIAGGAEIYRQALLLCGELLLTRVNREVEGDAFFPPFEGQFELAETIRETPEFDILRYRRRQAPAKPLSAEEQMAKFEDSLKESDWGHQPC